MPWIQDLGEYCREQSVDLENDINAIDPNEEFGVYQDDQDEIYFVPRVVILRKKANIYNNIATRYPAIAAAQGHRRTDAIQYFIDLSDTKAEPAFIAVKIRGGQARQVQCKNKFIQDRADYLAYHEVYEDVLDFLETAANDNDQEDV